MEFDAELIGMVKENTEVLCKDTIGNFTKDWPGGSYLVLWSQPMVTRERQIIAIGYKYNKRKVIYFIVIENAGIIQEGLPYLSQYLDQFTNVAIFPVARPLVTSQLFGAVNEVDSHKSKQSDLELDKFQVTQCGWLQLCMTVAMGININNCWKLFCYEVKRDYYEKFIGIR